MQHEALGYVYGSGGVRPFLMITLVLEAPLHRCFIGAHIVCGLRPVEANKGRKCFECLWLDGRSPSVWDSGAKGQACWRSAKA